MTTTLIIASTIGIAAVGAFGYIAMLKSDISRLQTELRSKQIQNKILQTDLNKSREAIDNQNAAILALSIDIDELEAKAKELNKTKAIESHAAPTDSTCESERAYLYNVMESASESSSSSSSSSD